MRMSELCLGFIAVLRGMSEQDAWGCDDAGAVGGPRAPIAMASAVRARTVHGGESIRGTTLQLRWLAGRGDSRRAPGEPLPLDQLGAGTTKATHRAWPLSFWCPGR